MAMRHGGGGGGFAGAHQLATIPSTYQQPRANAQPGLPQPRHIGGGKGASSSTKRGVAGEYGMAVAVPIARSSETAPMAQAGGLGMSQSMPRLRPESAGEDPELRALHRGQRPLSGRSFLAPIKPFAESPEAPAPVSLPVLEPNGRTTPPSLEPLPHRISKSSSSHNRPSRKPPVMAADLAKAEAAIGRTPSHLHVDLAGSPYDEHMRLKKELLKMKKTCDARISAVEQMMREALDRQCVIQLTHPLPALHASQRLIQYTLARLRCICVHSLLTVWRSRGHCTVCRYIELAGTMEEKMHQSQADEQQTRVDILHRQVCDLLTHLPASLTIHDHPWPSMTIHGHPWPSVPFHGHPRSSTTIHALHDSRSPLHRQAVRHMLNASMAEGFGAWRDMWRARTHSFSLLKMTRQHLHENSGLEPSFRYWAEVSDGQRVAKHINALTERLTTLEQRLATATADKDAALKKQLVELTGPAEERLALKLEEEREARAQLLARQIVRRMQGQFISRGWMSWLEFHHARTNALRHVSRVRANLQGDGLADAFDEWAQTAATMKADAEHARAVREASSLEAQLQHAKFEIGQMTLRETASKDELASLKDRSMKMIEEVRARDELLDAGRRQREEFDALKDMHEMAVEAQVRTSEYLPTPARVSSLPTLTPAFADLCPQRGHRVTGEGGAGARRLEGGDGEAAERQPGAS